MKPKSKERIKEKPLEIEEKEPKIGLETKKSIAAILMIGLAVLLMLAKLGKAGPIGEMAYSGLDSFFGWGYYLLPVMSVVVALVFLIGASCEKTSQAEVCNNPQIIEGEVICDSPPENCSDFILVEGEKVCTVPEDGK